MADDLLPDLLVLLDDGDVEMLLMGDDKDEREIEGGMDGLAFSFLDNFISSSIISSVNNLCDFFICKLKFVDNAYSLRIIFFTQPNYSSNTRHLFIRCVSPRSLRKMLWKN